MTLFLSLLPLYLFGNLHCIGMCGPLVMLLGQHRYRLFYFAGRLASYSLAGLLAGELGAVLHVFLKQYRLAEITSLLCAIAFMVWGIQKIARKGAPPLKVKGVDGGRRSLLKPLFALVSTLLLKDRRSSTFLFGFLTVALPCGQTLVVFSACALAGDAWIGLANGFALALFTSPSLFFAMHTLTLFRKFKRYDRAILGGCSIIVGAIAACRGLAEMGWMSHWILNPESDAAYHLVIY